MRYIKAGALQSRSILFADFPERKTTSREYYLIPSNMRIRRTTSQILVWDNVIYREQNSVGERNKKDQDESPLKARTLKAGKLWKEDAWKRIRKSLTKAFSCKPKRGVNNVPYASMTRLDQLCVCEDELTKSQKKLRFCSKQIEQQRDTSDYEHWEESEEEDIDDSVFVQRSESFERRRMAICKELERNIQVGCRSRSTSLLELHKTMVINNRFKEMGL